MTESLDFAYGLGVPAYSGRLKACAQDFIVDELPSFVPAGHGEHALMRVRKTGHNTEWVAAQLARHAGVRSRDVGFAGRKDRRAVATQWFSCRLPGRLPPRWQDLGIDGVEVLQSVRHDRKLRPGALRGNHFSLVVRELPTDPAAIDWLERRLRLIAQTGVPNYFGPQRFGINGQNLRGADEVLLGRTEHHPAKRDIYLSAARAWLFNAALSRRIEQGRWGQRKPDGGSCIGALFGPGECEDDDYMRQLKPAWCEALLRLGVRRNYRALTLDPQALRWDLSTPGLLRIEFDLPRGCFATTVLRELVRSFEDEQEWCLDE